VTLFRSRGSWASFGEANPVRSRAPLAAAALAAAFLLLHLPFLPASLEDLDSINFALGIRHFDVAAHQPHPPGYPLLVALAKGVHLVVQQEWRALSLVSIVAGSLSAFALVVLFRRITEPSTAPDKFFTGVPLTAAMLAGTAPLYWFTAARPLSDMPGLAAALGAQALLVGASTTGGLSIAAFAAALAVGLRSQVLWLTAPLVLWALARWRRNLGLAGAASVVVSFVAGLLVWFVPLVALSGGLAAYGRAVFNQGAEDLSGVQMLWTTRTPRQALIAFNSAFVAPWGGVWVAAVVLILGTIGAVRLYRARRSALFTMAVAFGPYLVFDLLFQESVTTRYALPLVVPVAFLAACGIFVAGPTAGMVLAVALAAFDAHIGGLSVASYASEPAPAFRLLGDMRQSSSAARADAPVLAMHRREDLDLRRPMVWASALSFSDRLAAPPKHEWLETVKYWNAGGRRTVWFIADPLRTDLALVDHRDAWLTRYRWALEQHGLVGGVRPDVMDWYRLRDPSWYLGEGWALTPESAGVAEEDGRGPGRGGIQGWIRRREQASTLMIGGRHLALSGPDAHLRVAVDGRAVDASALAPGFFLKFLQLPPGSLAGKGDYAALTVSADSPQIAVEQFDVRSANHVVFGFGDGWQEAEYNPATGLQWRWMSERGVLRVHAAGRALALTIRGEAPAVYFRRPSQVVVRAGGQVVSAHTLWRDFTVRITIPAELVNVSSVPGGDESVVTIETDQFYVPAQRSRRTRDQRHLGLRVFECELRPSEASSRGR
jgi:hypothetical protein